MKTLAWLYGGVAALAALVFGAASRAAAREDRQTERDAARLPHALPRTPAPTPPPATVPRQYLPVERLTDAQVERIIAELQPCGTTPCGTCRLHDTRTCVTVAPCCPSCPDRPAAAPPAR